MNESDLSKRKVRWYQFRLRTLLLFVLLVSLGMSWFAVRLYQARKQREAVEAIVKAGAVVYYDYEWKQPRKVEPPGPPWLRRLLGDDLFRSVVSVVFWGQGHVNAELEHVKGLTELKSLVINDTNVTDAGLEYINGLTNLEELSLYRTEISDAGVKHLERLTSLEELNLGETLVTDTGMKYLKGLTKLKSLTLNQTLVSDAGLQHLEGLTRLEYLCLDHTHTTDKGVEKLSEALPNCDIYRNGHNYMATDSSSPPRLKHHWYQFSLLLVVLLASVGLSWFAVKLYQARKQRE